MGSPTPFSHRTAVAALLAASIALVACSQGATPSASSTGATAPSPGAPTNNAQVGISGAPATPTPVPPTPITSVAGPTERPQPIGTPGATIAAGLSRVKGRVFDAQSGKPLQGVCVIIGPGSCQPVQPRTDTDGRFVVDLPIGSGTLDWDFTFAVTGYAAELRRIRAVAGEQTLDVPMKPPVEHEPKGE